MSEMAAVVAILLLVTRGSTSAGDVFCCVLIIAVDLRTTDGLMFTLAILVLLLSMVLQTSTTVISLSLRFRLVLVQRVRKLRF